MTEEDGSTRPKTMAIKETSSMSLSLGQKSNRSEISTESPSTTGDSDLHNDVAAVAGFQASLTNLSARVFSQERSTNPSPPSAYRHSAPRPEDAIAQFLWEHNDTGNARKSAPVEGAATAEVVVSQNAEIVPTKPGFNSIKSAARLSDADPTIELESLSSRLFLLQPEPPASIIAPPPEAQAQAQLQPSVTGVSTESGDQKKAAEQRQRAQSVASKSTLTRSVEGDVEDEEAAALLAKFLAASGQDPLAAKAIAQAFAAQAQEEDSTSRSVVSSANLYPAVSAQLPPVPASALPPLKHRPSHMNATPRETPWQIRRAQAEQKREARLEKMGRLIERMSDSKRRLQEQMEEEVLMLSQGQAENTMFAPNVSASPSAAQPRARETSSGRAYGGVPGWAFSQMTLGSQSNSSAASSIPAPPPNNYSGTRGPSLKISSMGQQGRRPSRFSNNDDASISLQDAGEGDGPEEPPDQEESFIDHDIVHVDIVQVDEYSPSINGSTDSHNTGTFHQRYGPLANIVEAKAISSHNFSNQASVESAHMDERSPYFAVATPVDYPLKAFLENKGLSLSVGLCVLVTICGVSLLIAGLGFQVFSKGDVDPITFSPTEIPTLSPTAFPTVNADDFLEILVKFTDRADLERIGSPQQKALLWLANKDETGIDFEDPLFRQRYALVVLYYATSGEKSWLKGEDTWLTPSLHVCDWDAVHIQCFTDTSRLRRVSSLDLKSNRLVGTLPSELRLLSARLNYFVLRDNQISGTIPSELFSSFTLLSYFDVSKNQLNGTISSTIGNLEVLSHFNAVENQLTGSVPESIYNLTRLKMLDVGDNNLTGTISEKIKNLKFLEIVNMKTNNFSGSIPEAVGQMPDLRYVWLDNNELTGRLPNWTAAAIARMEEVTLSNNKLTGPIFGRTDMDAFRGELRLSKLDISNNHLTGTVPSDLGYLLTWKYIDLSNNMMTGSIFSLDYLNKLEVLRLNDNLFEGVIPKFPINCKTLQLHGNDLSGDLKNSIAHIKSLEVLSISGNFGGTLPTELARMKKLGYLNLSNCSLTGTIPSIFQNMNELGYFSVGDNNLVGSIPSSFGKLTVLRQMFLNDNKLTGTIPMELSQMNYLSILSVKNNNLIGSIPSELARLEMLNELLLSGNNFEGSISDEMCVRGIDKITHDSTVTCGCCSKYKPPLL